VRVGVGVMVGVAVGVLVGPPAGVLVGVLVGVRLGVLEGVTVGVLVGVLVAAEQFIDFHQSQSGDEQSQVQQVHRKPFGTGSPPEGQVYPKNKLPLHELQFGCPPPGVFVGVAVGVNVGVLVGV
jgi:hypothetical protein